jgi:hypothetical protein
VREIFEYYKALLHKEDLLEFAKGGLFKESIVNVYFKILEKANLVLQCSYNFHLATTRQWLDYYQTLTGGAPPQKIMYFNTNFIKRINNPANLKDCLN